MQKEKKSENKLVTANKELALQHTEKKKRAAELVIANKELAFQNKEKEKRADELIVANKELVFQNEEKGKRADELVIANKELVFQNKEKQKRAEELTLINTELKKSEEKLTNSQRLYSFISHINQTIVHVKDEYVLFGQACRIAVDLENFSVAWIGMFDTEGKKIALVEQCGMTANDITLFTNGHYVANGIQDMVLQTGTYYICNDIAHDPQLENQKQYMTARGLHSCMILPLKRSGDIIGTFNLYATEINFFDKKEIALLVEVAGDISFALDMFGSAKLHKDTESNLRKSEARLKEAQAIAHIGNWEVDILNGVNTWSDEFYHLMGVSNTEIQPSPEAFLSLFHPEDLVFGQKKVAEAFETLTDSSFNFRFIRKDGAIRHGYTEWRFEFDEHKKPIRLYGVIQDVTETKAAEYERQKIIDDLAQRNKDLEQFTYIVSHNLRSPVANILGISEAMRTLKLDEAEKEEMMFSLSTSVMKLNTVIQDLNHILQTKRNIAEQRETVSFAHLIKNISVSLDEQIKNEQVTIKTDFSEIDKIETLKSYLYSVFFNLISNSIKYRQADLLPIIVIKSYKINDKVEIHFSDNGLGIDMQKKGDMIFGLYKRFHNHTDGKGMGLFMVKTQVETLGGKISIESEVNKGTTFIIQLPL